MPRPKTSSARRLATLALTVALGLGATSCGGDVEPTGTDETSTTTPTESDAAESPTEAAAPAAQVIDITINGDEVVPNGERVKASVGEELTLRVTADVPGEIHVHSTPELVLPYGAGTTEVPLTIEQPGVVEVESHDPALVIVQLEVR